MAASRFHHLTGGVLAAALASTLLLAGCGEHHVAPAQEVSAPAERPDALAGAPADLASPPPAPVEAPPPAYAPPPPPGRPGDREVIYDLGPVVQARDTMAPIPNPTERGHARRHRASPASHAMRTARHVMRRHAPAPMARAPHRAAAVHRHATRAVTPRAAASAHRTAHAAAPAHRAAPVTPPAHRAASTAPSATKPGAAKPGAARPAAAPRDATPLAVKPAGKEKAASHGVAKTKPGSAERTAKLMALQASLKDTVAKTALLNAPELKPDQPADVTLTLPADFASAVRDQAEKQGLQDAAASVNMTALLSGDGYAVAPDEVQSQPLTIGQPTEFHWTVTAQPGAKGGLHADVGADLLGGGDEALQLGSATPSGKGGLHISPRAWGAGLLVLLAVIVFAWLSRGRSTAAARRRARNSTGLYERPLDMRSAAPPPPPGDREV